jgi:hypothetical protein
LNLLARTGDPVPGGTNGETISYLVTPNIDNLEYIGVLGLSAGPVLKDTSPKNAGFGWTATISTRPNAFNYRISGNFQPFLPDLSALVKEAISYFKGHVANALAYRADLSGPNIGSTNDQAVVAGPPTNPPCAALKGSPAPGTQGFFSHFPLDSRSMALTPDGNVAFIATTTVSSGIWFGKAGTLQSVVQTGLAPPIPSLGTGYTVNGVGVGPTIEVNGRGELAFDVVLSGPGLNNTNSHFAVAGPPNALRVVAQSGQPAPGIPGAFFRSYNPYGFPVFDDELIGADGTVVFAASYGTNGYDFGLWLAPTNGAVPVLLMRNGQQAPGCPAGVVFTNSLAYLPTTMRFI